MFKDTLVRVFTDRCEYVVTSATRFDSFLFENNFSASRWAVLEEQSQSVEEVSFRGGVVLTSTRLPSRKNPRSSDIGNQGSLGGPLADNLLVSLQLACLVTLLEREFVTFVFQS